MIRRVACAALCAVAIGAAWNGRASAQDPTVANIAAIDEVFKRNGATDAEIEEQNATLLSQSPADVAKFAERMSHASPDTVLKRIAYLRSLQGEQSEHPTLKLGSPLPDFNLKGVDGKMHTPADYKDSPILVVMFISNHCPVAQLYETREKKLYEDYARKGVAFVAIQPDNVEATGLTENQHSDLDDSYESMVKRAAYRHFPFPYLDDGEKQEAADKFGPKVTPHIFIFDKDRKLRYEGRIDDNIREARAKTHDARDALDAMLAGKPVAVEHTPVFGCSTKWKSRTEAVQKETKEWLARPVTVESVSLDGLKQLRKNDSGKMLMINFWATWCGPCRTEYPDLLTTYQWYRARHFDFVSVSVDSPESKKEVQEVLAEMHSGVRNLQIDTEDVYAAQKAFDPSWESGVPYTIVLSPEGKVIYRAEGEVDILKMRRAILASYGDTETGQFAGHADYWKQ